MAARRTSKPGFIDQVATGLASWDCLCGRVFKLRSEALNHCDDDRCTLSSSPKAKARRAVQSSEERSTIQHFEPELELRTDALDAKSSRGERRAAIAVLADYYEEHGQLSRAGLWRELLSAKGERPSTVFATVLNEVPDLLTRPHRPQASDCRRNQMIWLLRKQGASVRKVGVAFGLSGTRVEQIVSLEDRRINEHARKEQLKPSLAATERLIAAGALPADQPTRPGRQEPWFDFCDEPPENWPAEHKRRRKIGT